MAHGARAHVPRARRPAQLGAWAEKFARLFTQSIYKWVQAPLSLHVGNLDLDRERALQLPVVQKTRVVGARGPRNRGGAQLGLAL